MSDLTPGQKNHLRDCALTSFEHMDAAVERILAEQETRLRESIAADIEAAAGERVESVGIDHVQALMDAAHIARGGEHV